jgi:hypothetical protein
VIACVPLTAQSAPLNFTVASVVLVFGEKAPLTAEVPSKAASVAVIGTVLTKVFASSQFSVVAEQSLKVTLDADPPEGDVISLAVPSMVGAPHDMDTPVADTVTAVLPASSALMRAAEPDSCVPLTIHPAAADADVAKAARIARAIAKKATNDLRLNSICP